VNTSLRLRPLLQRAALRPFFADDEGLHLLDQRALPGDERWVLFPPTAQGLEGVAVAIESLAVRGAPAIGGAAAAALSMMAQASSATDVSAFVVEQRHFVARLRRTRPTAVNLFVALDAVSRVLDAAGGGAVDVVAAAVVAAAEAVIDDDVLACAAMGEAGASLLNDGDVVITICHTGALATCGQGTALGVVKSARAAGKDVAVVALETRPLLQGARLTAWECQQVGIPVTLITDGMASFAMARGIGGRRIARALVGADRVASNGDTANKIGTYQLAVACRHHGVPLHVVAPRSTFDRACPDGAHIPIEERAADEVRTAKGTPLSPSTVAVWNPAFDVTPADLITSWVTESGVVVRDENGVVG
jgi:methylthioribose-1-phosphate isomerase